MIFFIFIMHFFFSLTGLRTHVPAIRQSYNIQAVIRLLFEILTMSRPMSAKQRPLSAGKTLKMQRGDVISYEDLLVAQYLEELKKSPPYTKQHSVAPSSPYLQKLSHSHIVPTPSRQRPQSATTTPATVHLNIGKTGKPKVDPKFIADPTLWDPATPRDDHNRTVTASRRRPVSAPVYKRPLSAYSRPGSAKRGKKTKPLYKRQPHTIVAVAFRNGTRDSFARIAAPNIKVLLEMATDKLGLPGAGRRIFLEDGAEVFTPKEIPRESEVYISCGEPFKDPFKPVKSQTNMSKSAAWTVNGVTWNQEAKHKTTKIHMSKRFKCLIEQSRRRVLVFKNGTGNRGVEIVADPERFEDFLVACTAKCELGSYARVLYDWEGNAVGDLEEAPVLDKCLQTSTTLVLGPLWVSKGEGFSPKGVDEFLQGLIKYTKAKLKEAKHYRSQLLLGQNEDTKQHVQIVTILSMSESEIEETLQIVENDVEEFSNALNRLKEQHEKILTMLGDEEDQGNHYTMKHIDQIDIDHKLVGTKGIRLKVFENGTDTDETVVYFNIQAAERGLKNHKEKKQLILERFLSECGNSSSLSTPKKNPAIRPVAKKVFNEVGKEIKDVYELEYDQCLWLSYGEPWKNPFTYVISASFDKVRVFDIDGEYSRRTAIREQLMKEDVEGKDKSSKWSVSCGIPDDFKNITQIHEGMDSDEKEQCLNIIDIAEIPVQDTYFLRAKDNPDLLVYPEVVVDIKRMKTSSEVWPQEAQAFAISKNGYIFNRAMPQLVLAVLDQKVSTTISHPTKGPSRYQVEGFVVGFQKKMSSANQQWRFTKEGYICADSNPHLALTFLGSQLGQEDTQVTNTEDGVKGGQRFYLAVCDRLSGKMAKAQRFGIKQEKFDNLGQWKYNQVDNPEWNKQAISWPVDQKGELNENFDWPMEGYLVAFAPPLVKKETSTISQSGNAPLRLLVLKNGIRDISKAAAVVGPDLNNMRKDLHAKDKKKKKQTRDDIETESIDVDGMVHCDEDLTVLKLEFILFLERCTNTVSLPFAGRRLFDENGKELFSLRGLRRDQLVYVSCGEAWSDPNLSKAEQQRRYLLANLASDVQQIQEYCILRNPHNLVLEIQGEIKAGAKIIVGECGTVYDETVVTDNMLAQQEARYLAYQQAAQENQAARDTMDEITNHGKLTAHEQAHIKADERLERLKLPWERVVNKSDDEPVDSEEQFFSNKEMYRRYRPKKKQDDNLAMQLQKFTFEDGYIACTFNKNMVLGLSEAESSQNTDVILVKRSPDDIFQRWIMHENGIIQCKNNPSLVLGVSMPVYQTKSESHCASYYGCQVVVQKRKITQFGRANQRFYHDESMGYIQAFHTDTMDKEITAANRANVCTFAVMGTTEIDQPGYIAEVQIEKGAKPKKLLVCSSCARSMRGRYKLEKIVDNTDFACSMGNAKDHGIKQVGSFQCLNGKVDLSTHEAEHTLEEWQGQLSRLRDECSVRAIAKEISAAKAPYTVKVLAYKNGAGRIKPGEVIIGSSIPGILEQATYKLGLGQAARRLYTNDGNIMLDVDDLVEWAREQYVKNARKQIRAEKRAKRIAEEKANGESSVKQRESLMDKVDFDSEESTSENESESAAEEQEFQETSESFIVGHEVQEDRRYMDEHSNMIIVPNLAEPIENDGYIMHWILFAKKPGQLYLLVVRPDDKNPTAVTVKAMAPFTVTSRGMHQVDVSHYPMECGKGDFIAFYCQDNPVIPFDLDDNKEEYYLHVQPKSVPEVGKTIQMNVSVQKGKSRQYSLNAFIQPVSKAVIDKKTRPKSGKVTQKRKKAKGPYIESPPVEMVLRHPIEVWVSSGEPLIKPEKVEQSYEQEIQHREERAAVALELEREKHTLRQMQGRRYGKQDPGDYRATSNPTQPVYIQGHWQDPTLDELQKHDAVHQLQMHLNEVKSNQKRKMGIKTCNIKTTKRLYSQPAMKRILVFPNGENVELAQYVWGETINQILDNSTTRLNLRKAAKYIFTLEGNLVQDMSELDRDMLVCVGSTKQFMIPKQSRQLVEVKATWGRARKQFGPSATDIMVMSHTNDNIDVDPFGPSDLTGGPTKPRKGVYPSSGHH